MTTFVGVVLVLLSLVMLWAVGKLIQVNYFSKAVRKVIYSEDLYTLDVNASYNNFTWSAPWNYNFDRMIVK